MKEYHTPPEAKPLRRWVWLRRLVLATALYALFGFVLLPALIEWQLPKQASEQLGRQVTLDKARFNPFSMTLRLEGLTVKEADSSTNALAIGAAETDLQWRSIIHWGLVFSRLEIEAPRFSLIRLDEKTTNWSDVIARFASSDPPPEPQDDGPLRFSINNIHVADGEVDIDDRVAGLIHTVRQLTIGIPFISAFPAEVEHYVQPELSALINDAPFELNGRTRPFDEQQTTVFDLQLAPFDIAPFLAYLPYEPQFRIVRGQLATALELAFEQPADGTPRLTLVGTARLIDLATTDLDDKPLASLEQLKLDIGEFDVFANRLHVVEARLTAPDVTLARLANGSLNLDAFSPPTTVSKAAPAPSDDVPPATADAEDAGQGGFAFSVDRIRLERGRVAFSDAAAPAGKFATVFSPVEASIDGLGNAGESAPVNLTFVSDAGESVAADGAVVLAPFSATLTVAADKLPLTRYAPYFANQLKDAAITAGAASANVPIAIDADGVKVSDARLDLSDFALKLADAKEPAVSLKQLALTQVTFDSAAPSAAVGVIDASGGVLRLVRSRRGEIDLAGIAATSSDTAAPAGEGKPMSISLGAIKLTDWSIAVRDEGVRPAVSTTLDQLVLTTGAIKLDALGDTSVQLKSRLNGSGGIALKGKVNLASFDSNLRLDLSGLDLRRFSAYVPQAAAIDIRSARLGAGGQLSLSALSSAKPRIVYRGRVGLDDLVARDTLNDTDFLRWKKLSIDGIDVNTEPLSVGIDTISLSNFYSRLILDAKGRLNFRELTAVEGEAKENAEGESQAVVDAPPAALPPIRIGKIQVDQGNVQYSDRFIKPNYDADLQSVSGSLTELRSEPDSVATLSLTAALDHGAPVEITGQLNPLRQDRYLDILATVRDFQLPTISSYSGKYVGYGIAKGKLSADLSYKIEDRVLTAKNDVLLDQLTFGQKVESKDAVNLPVQLAVALLKNSKGEIDLSVPVSGTLDDPQFSIGGLVWKAFFNLIVKAVTSPFALLGSAFGGGEELAYVEFAPGSAQLSSAEREKLETLAKALSERPALKLSMTGWTDPAADAEGLRTRWIEDRMREFLRQELIDEGKAPPALESIKIPPDRRAELLEDVYDEAEIKKPRNAIGFAKSLPPEEMTALLKAAAPAGPEALAALGKRRAQVVRDWLVGEGKVSASRIFLVAPDAIGEAKAEPKVEFSLK
ncbi:DUF748 domain-containing protein [Nitrogeniibacter aestuarii]|uniref:DUF748 domain-containing protein n=1 Tax=Nitrogeniibacter aestuarii TaxID=2815343 RepID=UPI001D114839|nr:DUF748 domain-containing protein [Nitrogeniibacter aestuarii]